MGDAKACRWHTTRGAVAAMPSSYVLSPSEFDLKLAVWQAILLHHPHRHHHRNFRTTWVGSVDNALPPEEGRNNFRTTARLIRYLEEPENADEVASMELDIDLELADLLEAEACLQKLHDYLHQTPHQASGDQPLARIMDRDRLDELDYVLNDLVRRWLGAFKPSSSDHSKRRTVGMTATNCLPQTTQQR